MRICLLCCEYPPGPHGGIGTFTRMLAQALAARGDEVRVAGLYSASYPAPDFEEDGGVRVWRLREAPTPAGWILARSRLCRLVLGWAREGSVDLIEAPDYQGLTAYWPRCAVPLVVRLHGSMTYFAAELCQRVDTPSFWLERTALHRADFWCSVCEYTAVRTKALFRLESSPDAILYNPVEMPLVRRDASGAGERVVFTGTLTPKKGVAPLVRSWPLVLEERPRAELHLYGKDGRTACGGSMRAYLQSQLPPGARGSVHFHEHVSREALFQEFASARAAVFPSYAEAFAVAPLEAMACGCPTIYSLRGSGPEVIGHGVNGLLVDPEHPVEIARAVIELLADREFAERLGRSGRETVRERFSLEKLAPENAAFYERSIEQFRTARRAA